MKSIAELEAGLIKNVCCNGSGLTKNIAEWNRDLRKILLNDSGIF